MEALAIAIIALGILAWDVARRFLAAKRAKLSDALAGRLQESADQAHARLDDALQRLYAAEKQLANLHAAASRREALGPRQITGARRRA